MSPISKQHRAPAASSRPTAHVCRDEGAPPPSHLQRISPGPGRLAAAASAESPPFLLRRHEPGPVNVRKHHQHTKPASEAPRHSKPLFHFSVIRAWSSSLNEIIAHLLWEIAVSEPRLKLIFFPPLLVL